MPLKLAMLGMIEGNGHPYSWSAIINGYDWEAMSTCPYPAILDYLGPPRDPSTVGFDDAAVTHVWTDNPAEAPSVAAASLIPNILDKPEDAIGQVDAVIIATDDGADHVRRCRPFIEAGLPIFIDKPMATTRDELDTLVDWQRQGNRILSSSGLRYDPDIARLREHLDDLGELRWISAITAKTWERYGIHCLEPIYSVLGPGFTSIRMESDPGGDVAFLRHQSGTRVTIAAIHDAFGSFGKFQFCGTKSMSFLPHRDTYTAFRDQLRSFVDFLKTGERPFPFEHTIEMMEILIAGIRSRKEGGSTVSLSP